MMLARHAEDLFWAGRYLERAQDAARILDVAYHAAVTSPQGSVDLQLADVLSVLLVAEPYREVHDDIDGRRVLAFCVHDRRNASSVVSLMIAMRENIRRARELLSSEVWEVVNDTYLRLRARTETLGDLHAHLDFSRRPGGRQRLRIRIGDDEFDALEPGRDHVVDRVAACPANSEYGDPGPQLTDVRSCEIHCHGCLFHTRAWITSPQGPVRRRPSRRSCIGVIRSFL
jgi:hypothetical protein